MPRLTAADILVTGILYRAACIARYNRAHPSQLVEDRLRAPEAAAAEDGHLSFWISHNSSRTPNLRQRYRLANSFAIRSWRREHAWKCPNYKPYCRGRSTSLCFLVTVRLKD